LRWANVNNLNQLDIGLELISPSATIISAKLGNNALEGEALLLPEVGGLKQAASIIIARGFCKLGDILDCNASSKPSKITINPLIELTARFERFQFSLI
jgi:hypothetical protein